MTTGSTEQRLREALGDSARAQLGDARVTEPGFSAALDEAARMLARIDALELPVFGTPEFADEGALS